MTVLITGKLYKDIRIRYCGLGVSYLYARTVCAVLKRYDYRCDSFALNNERA